MNYNLKEIVKEKRILSPDLFLDQLMMDDAKELFKLTDKNRAYLKKWLPWLDYCIKETDSLSFIQQSNKNIETNKSLVLGIFSFESLIGVISFHEIDWIKREGSIGYWIGERFQGQGFITNACQEMIKIGFNEINLKRILINCAVQNKKSRAIPERLSFQEKEILYNKENLYGTYVDHISYYLDKFSNGD